MSKKCSFLLDGYTCGVTYIPVLHKAYLNSKKEADHNPLPSFAFYSGT